MQTERKILDAEAMDRALSRMAHEILERNQGAKNVVLVGIRTGGVFIAQRLGAKIREFERIEVPIGIMDITLYRDDIALRNKTPQVRATEIPFSLDDKNVVLVDDVLFTGRSIRAAMDAIVDFGRPQTLQLAVLIDRGHRELPIRPDYVGKNIPTSRHENVEVSLKESGKEDQVLIREGSVE
ncbi:MAG: bifunctional pyr operon transcriptional regulator/uracil phosphoribosyltransferase PyrR [Deltaproteobacteria bacterium]|nr:bifunctional pyr operon transcriptional regulator/uracil phosphoribosyltransferase PyrR [Deltaproteobacteria bacterium]